MYVHKFVVNSPDASRDLSSSYKIRAALETEIVIEIDREREREREREKREGENCGPIINGRRERRVVRSVHPARSTRGMDSHARNRSHLHAVSFARCFRSLGARDTLRGRFRRDATRRGEIATAARQSANGNAVASPATSRDQSEWAESIGI